MGSEQKKEAQEVGSAACSLLLSGEQIHHGGHSSSSAGDKQWRQPPCWRCTFASAPRHCSALCPSSNSLVSSVVSCPLSSAFFSGCLLIWVPSLWVSYLNSQGEYLISLIIMHGSHIELCHRTEGELQVARLRSLTQSAVVKSNCATCNQMCLRGHHPIVLLCTKRGSWYRRSSDLQHLSSCKNSHQNVSFVHMYSDFLKSIDGP